MNNAERVAAVQRALKKYDGTVFKWGEHDCLRLARTVLVGCGATLPRLPTYSTERAAIRQLKKAGHDSLASLLREHCQEWPAAFGLAGDVGVVRGDGALDALVVRTDNGKWLGWYGSNGPFGVLRFPDVKDAPQTIFRAVPS
jgi:hypothetical protein